MRGLLSSQFPLWAWASFGAAVLVMLALDLYVHRGNHTVSRRGAIIWSAVWVGTGLLFGVLVWIVAGGQQAQEYLAAYLIEQSLSLDNLFVFLIVFQSLNIPRDQQHRVLFWGIFGAIIFRGLFIFGGVAAIERWSWIDDVFGALLLVGAYRAARENPAEQSENRAVRWLARFLPITHEIHGKHFVAEEAERRVATPLLIALLAIEVTDIVFAIDSVPAVFSISRARLVIYSSNIFAILGLRALYTVLAHTIGELEYLHYGLAGVLAFAGVKLILGAAVPLPPLVSVGVVVLMIGAATWASMRARKHAPARDEETARSG